MAGHAARRQAQGEHQYISANPTGPMHVGHGRWAALGSATANLMRHAGYEVFEEFYINDHGVQMDKFGLSIAARYLQQLGHEDAAVPGAATTACT